MLAAPDFEALSIATESLCGAVILSEVEDCEVPDDELSIDMDGALSVFEVLFLLHDNNNNPMAETNIRFFIRLLFITKL